MPRPHVSPAAELTALSFVVLSYGLMQTMLVPTIGALQRDLHASPTAASWAVLSAMLLSSAVLTPLLSTLADRYGRRRILLAALAGYLIATLAAIGAPNIDLLMLCRIGQGVSLTLLPLSFAIIRETLPQRQAAFGISLTAGLVTGSAGAGLLLGGVLVDHASWRWLFVAGAAIVAVALLLSALWVPEHGGRGGGGLDLRGAALLAGALVALLLAITQGPTWGWGSARVLALFGLAAGLGYSFVAVERRVAMPLIDLGLLTERRLAFAHLGALTLGVNQFVLYVAVPRLAELPRPAGGFGATVTGAALILLPGTVLTVPASWARGPLTRRLGSGGVLAAGLAIAALGALLLWPLHGDRVQVGAVYALSSVGFGLAMSALPGLVNAVAPPGRSGAANGVNTVARTVGGAIGSQLAAVALSGAGLGTGLAGAFGAAAGVAAVGAVLGVPLGVLGRSPVGAQPAAAARSR